MTENTAVATVNYVGNNKIGTVGPPIKGVKVKIANDGEILVKGDRIGLYENPSKLNKDFKLARRHGIINIYI